MINGQPLCIINSEWLTGHELYALQPEIDPAWCQIHGGKPWLKNGTDGLTMVNLVGWLTCWFPSSGYLNGWLPS